MDWEHQLHLDSPDIPSKFLVCRKVSVEEVYQDLDSNTAVIRKFKYKEINGVCQAEVVQQHLVGNNRLQISQRGQNTYQTLNTRDKFKNTSPGHNWHITKKSSKYKGGNHGETPMEVDSSGDNLVLGMNQFVAPMLKLRKRRSKGRNNKVAKSFSTAVDVLDSEPSKKFSTALLVLIAVLTGAGLYIILIGDRFIYVNRSAQLDNIKRELLEGVLHQDDAIVVVLDNLEKMSTWEDQLKILPFVGTTGVGKTFTVNLIKKHFSPQLVHELNPNNLKNPEKQQKTIDDLNSCCHNLIIVDDLKVDDLDNLFAFIAKLPKSHFLLIIPIFNIQNTVDGVTFEVSETDLKSIRDGLERSGFYFELVLFDVLEPHMVEKWLRQELVKRRVNENRHDSLVKFLLDSKGIKYHGFKGINQKLLLALDDD